MESINNKESVELFVYLIRGSGITLSQTNNTPHLQLYTLRTVYDNASDEWILLTLLAQMNFPDSLSRDKSETLSSNMYAIHLRITLQR